MFKTLQFPFLRQQEIKIFFLFWILFSQCEIASYLISYAFVCCCCSYLCNSCQLYDYFCTVLYSIATVSRKLLVLWRLQGKLATSAVSLMNAAWGICFWLPVVCMFISETHVVINFSAGMKSDDEWRATWWHWASFPPFNVNHESVAAHAEESVAAASAGPNLLDFNVCKLPSAFFVLRCPSCMAPGASSGVLVFIICPHVRVKAGRGEL